MVPRLPLPMRLLALTFALLELPGLAHAHPDNAADPSARPPPPDVAAAPAHATRTPSGLAYVVLAPGTGTARPTRAQSAQVHYTGWTTDGRMFDSSETRGQPATFPLAGVIDGFAEALTLMVVGERIRVWIPEALAYGGRPGRPAGMLVFEIELLRIV